MHPLKLALTLNAPSKHMRRTREAERGAVEYDWDMYSRGVSRTPGSRLLAKVMPLNCNSFRFVLRCLAIYLVLPIPEPSPFYPLDYGSHPPPSWVSVCLCLCLMQSSSVVPFNLRRVLDTNAAQKTTKKQKQKEPELKFYAETEAYIERDAEISRDGARRCTLHKGKKAKA
ncbi:uncharacterized protein [Drosophila pseudoobscura]|uniref:Uncharacterized protein n=1 Tax=Drosophila pseudoobscura pseudoobscura TaxID=46245 RepID=A0A6I8VBF2_DROPS|nr:uncharacterized protein LOC26532410 [Drosophila pseudoobscura]